MKTVWLSVDDRGEVVWNPVFLDFAHYWGFKPRLCKAYRAQTSMDEIASASFSKARFALFLVALFAALAMTLACICIYGVISYSVSRRPQEFGLRMALGARAGDVIRQVMAQGLGLAVGGIGIGIVATLALGRVLWSLLYQVSATDPLTFGAAAVAAIATASLACFIPARRVTTADPATALRAE